MKTLKKTLCMVLAVVMVVGVLILPASADDAADKAKAQEADYKTLTTYGIMHGRDGGAEALDEYVRRDEVATIVYRILTGDTSEDGKMAGNYKAAAKNFTDVATTNWAAGFIGYTAESKIFSGREGNKFDPTANVRGDELVKVMLRCLGYGEEGEYTGDGWNTRALYTAQEIGMLKGVDEEMDKPITRGAVSQIVKNAIDLPMAIYYDGTYSIYHDNAGRPAAPNSGATQNAKLVAYDQHKGDVVQDKWGIPSRTDKPVVSFNHPNKAVEYKLGEVKVSIEPVVEYYHAVTQCDLADDLDLEEATDFTVCVNGKANKVEITVDPVNTVAKIGAQGRRTLVYDLVPDDDDTPDTIVYLDTLLAEVTSVVAPTFDAKGHIKTPATLSMKVYTGKTTPVEVTQQKADGTSYAYAKGDMLLVNYIQSDLDKSGSDVDVSGTGTNGQEIKKDDKAGTGDLIQKGVNVKILDKATAADGKQTVIYYNQNKHKIDGVEYNDNNRFHLDDAKTTGGTYTWYYDNSPEGANVIGSKNIKGEANFGVITRIWAEITNGTTAVKANVTYADGRTATVDVGMVITDNMASTTHTVGTAVTKATAATGLRWAPATYLNASSKNPMAYKSGAAGASDEFYVSNSYEENLAADKVIGDTSKTNHIIGANLFRITASTGNKYDFVEVIGGSTNADLSAADPYVDYRGMGNASTDVVPNKVANGAVVINDNTRFLIKTGGNGTDAKPFTFETVVGYSNIAEYGPGEVDYADVDGDGYADVVYITAAKKGTSGDHIFFSEAVLKTDKGGNTWELHYSYDTSSKVYTVYGWLDGVSGAVQIKKAGDIDDDAIKHFVTESKGNQLWTITIKDGLVTDIDAQRNDKSAVTGTTVCDGSTGKFADGGALDDENKGMKDPGSYKDMSLIVYTCSGDSAKDSLDGTSLKLNKSHYFNIAPVSTKANVGEWADVLVENTVVYLVYNKSGVVSQAYIVAEGEGSSYGTGTPAAKSVIKEVSFNTIGQEVPVAYEALKDALDNAVEVSKKAFNANEGDVIVAVTADGTVTDHVIKSYVSSKAALTATLETGAFSNATLHISVGGYIVIGAKVDSTTTYYAYKIVE